MHSTSKIILYISLIFVAIASLLIGRSAAANSLPQGYLSLSQATMNEEILTKDWNAIADKEEKYHRILHYIAFIFGDVERRLKQVNAQEKRETAVPMGYKVGSGLFLAPDVDNAGGGKGWLIEVEWGARANLGGGKIPSIGNLSLDGRVYFRKDYYSEFKIKGVR